MYHTPCSEDIPIGKKSPPKAPAPPDPTELARTDAEFNRIDQFTPFGNLTFGGENRNQATLEFNPEIQALFDQQLGLDSSLLGEGINRLGGLDPNQIDLGQFGSILGDAGLRNDAGLRTDAGLQQFSAEGLPDIPTDFNQLRNDQEDAFFQRGRRLLNPEFNRQEDRLTQTLANQGLFAGDEAAGDQQQIFGENRNRAFENLADQSILRGGDEAGRELARILGTRGQMFGEQFSAAGFNNQANQQGLQNYNQAQQQGLQNFNQAGQQGLLNQNAARSQGLNEQNAIRSNQFNELASLLGLQQTQQPGLQSFFGPGQTDTLGAQALSQQQQNANFQANLGSKNAGLGGLFGLGSSLITGAGAADGFSNLFS